MKLYLIRHGEAAWTTPDIDRALTTNGQKNSASLFEKHQANWNGVQHVWVSPYQRAQETYQLLSRFLPQETQPITSNLLTPDTPSVKLLTELAQAQWAEHEAIVLVAHNPLLSRLLNLLTGQPDSFYQLGTSGIAALELPVMASGCADVDWIETGY